VPSEDDCVTCHAGQPRQALGIQPVQLAHDARGLDLADIAAEDLVAPAVAPTDPTAPGSGAARSALGVLPPGCGHCHDRARDAPYSCYGLTAFEARLYTTDASVEDTAAYRTAVDLPITFWSVDEGNTDDLGCRIVPGN